MGLRKVTDPALLDMLNGSGETTLPERKGEADIVQSGASAANSAASAQTENETRPYKVREAAANATKSEAEASKAAAGEKERADTRGQAASALRNVIDKIDGVALDSADNNGWFETGSTGALARELPTWAGVNKPALDIASALKTIDANTAFTALTNMRKESPTGGAVGNVSDTDLDLLKSTVSNLDPNQSQPQFLSQLADSKKHYLDMLRRIDPEAADSYKNKAGIRFSDDGTILLAPIDGGDEKNRIDPFGVIGAGSYTASAGGEAPDDKDGGIIVNGGKPLDGGGGSGDGGDPAPTGGGGGGGFLGVNSLGELGEGLGAGLGSNLEGALSFPALLIDPWYKPIIEGLGYSYPKDGIASGVRSSLGLPKNNTWTDPVLRGGTAALTGAGAARGLASLLQPGVAQSVATTLGASPLRDAAAGAAAGGGAEFAKAMGGGPLAQTGAALAAGMAGYGGASGVNAAMTPKVPTRMAQLAEKYGVNLFPADVGGIATKRLTSAAKASPISATPVVRAAQQTQADLGTAASRLARVTAGGDIPTTDVSGQWLRDAARRYSSKTRDIGGTNYDRVWRDPAASSLNIPASGSLSKIDGLLRDLRSAPNTNASAIANLERLRSDLAGGMTAKDMHGLRSEIRDGIYDGGLRSSREQSRMKQVGQALSDDMLGYLDQTGMSRTSNAIRRADAYWAQRVEHIDQVLSPIVGKEGQLGGEQIVSRVEAMARGKTGGGMRLRRLMGNMTGDEQQQVRATVIDRLGRVSEGAEGADAFSANRFIANWDRMTPQGKSALFHDEGLRKSLDDIAELAKATQSSGKLASYDPTNMPSVVGNVGVQIGLLFSHPTSAVLGAVAQALTGRLLASPRFARLLAKAPAAEDPRTFIEGLGVIGTREPLLRGDIANLQQQMTRALGQSPAPRVYAGDEDEDVRREPVER